MGAVLRLAKEFTFFFLRGGNVLGKVSSQRNERKERKNRKLQPIGTELSSFLLNSSL